MRIFIVSIVLLVSSVLQTVVYASTDVLPFAYVTVDGENTFDLNLIDLNTGDNLRTISEVNYNCDGSFSPDGQYLLYHQSDIGSPSTLNTTLLNLQTDEEINFDSFTMGRFSPDGTQLAFRTQSNEVMHYNIVTGEIMQVGEGLYYAFAWLDNERIVLWHRYDGYPRFFIWQPDNLTIVDFDTDSLIANTTRLFVSASGHQALYLVPDDDGENTTYLLDIASATISELRGIPTDRIGLVSWSSDGASFVFTQSGTIKRYDIVNQRLQNIVSTEWIQSMRLSPTGDYLAYVVYVPGGTYPSRNDIYIYDFTVDEQISINDYALEYTGEIVWASDTTLAYNYAHVSQYIPDRNPFTIAELYTYDVLTQTNTRLTDTPEIGERLSCIFG